MGVRLWNRTLASVNKTVCEKSREPMPCGAMGRGVAEFDLALSSTVLP